MFESFGWARLPDSDADLREKVRAVVREQIADLPPDRRARSWMGFDATFSRRLGTAGLLGLTLPAEYGGQGRSGKYRT